MTGRRRGSGWALMMIALLVAAAHAQERPPEPPQLSASPDTARAGYYQLEWRYPGEGEVAAFEIEEAEDPEFEQPRTIYRGQDRATSQSGRPDGEFHYRARVELEDGRISDWSDSVAVLVAHHSLTQALGLFAVGGLVFLGVVIVIILGHRRERQEAWQ